MEDPNFDFQLEEAALIVVKKINWTFWSDTAMSLVVESTGCQSVSQLFLLDNTTA